MFSSEKLELLINKLKTRKYKNIVYISVIFLIFAVFGIRFYIIAQENNFNVFNITRNNIKKGLPVDVLEMQKTDGVLLEPLTIKNNVGYVSGARIDNFKSGQKIANCKIVSVSKNIDLDTGMHVIKTYGCSDGLQYVENKINGFFVPMSAIHGDFVYVAQDGVAKMRKVIIANRDAQNALIKSGLNIGDIVILSHVEDNQKIKIAE
nr:hypothetical protein [Candidatus Enterousia merdequi]